MKLKTTIGWMAAGLLLAGLTTTALAQNGPGAGPKGRGYGGPPQNQQERAARQEACPKQNGDCPAVCPNGGQGRGQGQGNGAGYGWRRGARDGSGPRNAGGNCPAANPNAARGK